jgi:uncharacterized protein (TIGR00251 family)
VVRQDGDDVLLAVKAVPGASRDQIAGPMGDRLKVRVAAPAEGGKANKAIGGLLAKAIGVKPRDVTIESGAGSAEKVLRVRGATAAQVRAALGLTGAS